MKTSIIALVACVSLCGFAADTPKSADQSNIQGVWLAQSGSHSGQKEEVTGVQWGFKGDKLTVKTVLGTEERCSFKLDTASNPKSIVLQPEQTHTNDTLANVAYELNGDMLRVAIASPGSRPTSISDTNNQELLIFKRKIP